MNGLIDLGLTLSRSKKQLFHTIFNCEVRGENCLMSTFKFFIMKNLYSNDSFDVEKFIKTHHIICHLESTFLHLIKLAEDNNVDMSSLINFSNEVGVSIFHRATRWSLNLTIELLRLNVNVNRISERFETPLMKVLL